MTPCETCGELRRTDMVERFLSRQSWRRPGTEYSEQERILCEAAVRSFASELQAAALEPFEKRVREDERNHVLGGAIAHLHGQSEMMFDDWRSALAEHDARVRVATIEEACKRVNLRLQQNCRQGKDWLTCPCCVQRMESMSELRALATHPEASGQRATEEAPPCGGDRCHKADDGTWIHSSKSYGTCACELVAKMHAAAMGAVTGPRLGPVEDVESVREQRDTAKAEFQIANEHLQQALAQVSALREALKAIQAVSFHRSNCPAFPPGCGDQPCNCGYDYAEDAAFNILASTATAAESFMTRELAAEHSRATAACFDTVEGHSNYEPIASALAARDAKVREEERAKLKSFHATWKAEVRAAAFASVALEIRASIACAKRDGETWESDWLEAVAETVEGYAEGDGAPDDERNRRLLAECRVPDNTETT